MEEKLNKIYAEMNRMYKARLTYDQQEMLIYKSISICKNERDIRIYDNTTNMYRPLSKDEIIELYRQGIKKYCKHLKKSGLKKKLKHERKMFQIETIKQNKDRASRHYKKAISALNQLRKLN